SGVEETSRQRMTLTTITPHTLCCGVE
ncbi:tRNA (adenosine(37)-N6)-threonylcarbamoyltransferase complex dimerization subunit type 1 TsaB, partial [Salmonella enterica]|nr:tRNA (adenosine(37)-N6)-threonylcarbamoyltransferase complex dimerization subunit type 1 TsaB [Salmonella enterica]ECJ7854936.1 tRNA (adenosine(37)-N6)-threonylcarbamoyltransferase complex dimerization subunit type 1 TsaB [Salmonella enterica]